MTDMLEQKMLEQEKCHRWRVLKDNSIPLGEYIIKECQSYSILEQFRSEFLSFGWII